MKNTQQQIQEKFGDPIGSYAGDAPVGVRSTKDDGACSACEMLIVGGECGCEMEMNDGQDELTCPRCGMMPVQNRCGCSIKKSNTLDENVAPCESCGMLEIEGSCGCTHTQGDVAEEDSGLEEVTPKGYEKVVKALKKEPGVENPWAVAWSMKKKGMR